MNNSGKAEAKWVLFYIEYLDSFGGKHQERNRKEQSKTEKELLAIRHVIDCQNENKTGVLETKVEKNLTMQKEKRKQQKEEKNNNKIEEGKRG